MALPTVTHTYRLAAEPEIKFSNNGNAVMRLRLAANSNRKNDQGQWEKTDELFINATAFGDLAQAIADANLSVGQEVMVSGRLRTNSWTNDQGEKRSVIELRLDSIGTTIRAPRNGGGQGGGLGGGYGNQGGSGTSSSDPWNTGRTNDSEPPF